MLCNTSGCRIRQFWSRSKRKHRPLTMCRFFRSSPSLRKVQAMYRRLLNRSKRKVSAEDRQLLARGAILTYSFTEYKTNQPVATERFDAGSCRIQGKK